MPALLSILWLFAGSPADIGVDELEANRNKKWTECQALLSDISDGGRSLDDQRPRDLPDGLREAVEAWTQT